MMCSCCPTLTTTWTMMTVMMMRKFETTKSSSSLNRNRTYDSETERHRTEPWKDQNQTCVLKVC